MIRRLVLIAFAVVVLSGTTAAAGSCEGFEPNGNPTHADKAVQPQSQESDRRKPKPTESPRPKKHTLNYSCDWAFGTSKQDVNIKYRADGVAGGRWQFWNGRKGPFKAKVEEWPGGSAEIYATIHEKKVLTCNVWWGSVSDIDTAPWVEGGGTAHAHIDTVGDRHNEA